MQLTTLINLEYLDIGIDWRPCGPGVPGDDSTDEDADDAGDFLFKPTPPAPCGSLTIEGLTHIAHLTNLRWLGISNHTYATHLTKGLAGVSVLSTLTELTTMNINRTYGGSKGMAALRPVIENLEEFRASWICEPEAGEQAVAIALEPALKAGNLRVLDISGCPLLEYVCTTVAELSRLEELHIQGYYCTATGNEVSSLMGLSAVLQNLTALCLYDTAGIFPGFTPVLTRLTKLQRLQLDGMNNEMKFGSLEFAGVCQALTRLTALEMYMIPQAITTGNCKYLSCLQRLQRLSLGHCDVGAHWHRGPLFPCAATLASSLRSLQHLSCLDMRGWQPVFASGAEARDIFGWDVLVSELVEMSSLRELSLWTLGNMDFATATNSLAQLTQLNMLKIPGLNESKERYNEYRVDVALLRSTLTNLTALHFV